MKKLIALLVLAGCNAPGLNSETTNNKHYKVDLLFEHEGCKVYRFEDVYNHYYVVCSNNQRVTVNEGHHEAKHTRYQEINTVWK